ncbi:MAG: folate-binding protein [Pseudomonadota bacterium]
MTSPYAYLPDRAVLSLSGPDTITLLERLVTHTTDNWGTDETRYGALLTPQGKIIADYLAVRTKDGLLLDVAKDHIADLAKRLKLFRLRSQVEIAILEDLFVITGLEDAPEGVRPVSGASQVYLDPRYPGGRLRGFATRESWAAWYGYHPAEWSRSLDDYHEDRIANRVPEQGSDFGSAEVFPSDVNMDVLGGVALNKGCFVGQEVVSRMHRRGKIRKRTLMVYDREGEAFEIGAQVTTLEGRKIGQLTSAFIDHGLVRVRTDHLPSGADVLVLVGEREVRLEIPNWLSEELAAMETS